MSFKEDSYNMGDLADMNIDVLEESDSCVPLETNVDLLLTDVCEVQKILNSNNIGHHVDVNEIYEKLEELTYIVREERVGYVVTQLLYKFGVISDLQGDHAFKVSNTDQRETVDSQELPIPGDAAAQNGIIVTSFQSTPELDYNDTSAAEPFAGSREEEGGTSAINFLQDEACACEVQDVSKSEPSIFINHDNAGLSNFVLVGTADTDDHSDPENNVQLFGQEITEEAEFISGMFPQFELEQIIEFLNANDDVENRTDIVCKEMLKLQENMLQEYTEMSGLVQKKSRDNCNDSCNVKKENEDSKVSQERQDLDLSDNRNQQFVDQEHSNLVSIATDVIPRETENEKLVGSCESSVENNLSSIERNLTAGDQRQVNSNVVTNPETGEEPSSSDCQLVIPLHEATSDAVNRLYETNSSVHENHNLVFPSNSQENVPETSLIPSNVVPCIELSEVDETEQLTDILSEETSTSQLIILHEIEPSSELVPSVSIQASPETKESLSNGPVPEIIGSVSDLADDSSSSSSSKPLNSTSQANLPTFQIMAPPECQPIETGPSTSQFVSQGCRKKEITYEEFISSLPDVNIAILKEVWAQIGNNYSATKEFISQQLKDKSDNNHYHLLLSMFPKADPKYLQETSLMIGTDEAALADFIDEQLQDNESTARYHMLLAMFPKVDSDFLQERCFQVGNSDEGMRNLITELLNMNESDDNYHTLLDMFPESDPAFLREKADRIGNDSEAMKKFVADYLEEVESVQFRTLVALLPDADPEYLQEMYEKLDRNEESIKLFITEALENKNYPTRESYLKRQEIATLKRKYKEELNLQEYLDVIPDPWTFFRSQKRSSEAERRHALSYLESHFKTIPWDQINSTFQNNNYNLTLTCDQLENWQGPSQEARVAFQHIVGETEDIPVPFLQEVAFIENKMRMREFLERKEQDKKEAFELAKANGELLECQCCFDDEILDLDASTCAEGHIFCKECIKRSAEVVIGDGDTHFNCLTNCGSEFPLRVIQTVLNPTTFSRMLQRRQLEEVQAAGIQDLENCPFCEFATIPPTNSTVFSCLNAECMRDSCRKCKRPSHIPLRCDEVESKETKVRTIIEDRMTDALVRTCWQCKKKFIKESGCNKMTCSCGARMCYICRQPVTDYSHFNGNGGTEFHKCPLYSDLKIIHDVAVQEEGIKAKKEVQAENPDVELKHDPTEMEL